ncbi:hypothetical protein BB561_003501 [Smittium simulii]|uniref:Zn(2)-C6 fungal-type domain-containing protein n=1 Tax=Smittium simulii TaxID=133385 RepID=A0A2T9YKX6_9FUNG|nr:hypothetical protein BB561_003501 [Smittium simulii]
MDKTKHQCDAIRIKPEEFCIHGKERNRYIANNNLGSPWKPKRAQVKVACVNCQKACKKCDESRPCQRCIKYNLADSCVDSVRKERKSGIKRGPYKRRQVKNKNSKSPLVEKSPSSNDINKLAVHNLINPHQEQDFLHSRYTDEYLVSNHDAYRFKSEGQLVVNDISKTPLSDLSYNTPPLYLLSRTHKRSVNQMDKKYKPKAMSEFPVSGKKEFGTIEKYDSVCINTAKSSKNNTRNDRYDYTRNFARSNTENLGEFSQIENLRLAKEQTAPSFHLTTLNSYRNSDIFESKYSISGALPENLLEPQQYQIPNQPSQRIYENKTFKPHRSLSSERHTEIIKSTRTKVQSYSDGYLLTENIRPDYNLENVPNLRKNRESIFLKNPYYFSSHDHNILGKNPSIERASTDQNFMGSVNEPTARNTKRNSAMYVGEPYNFQERRSYDLKN